MQMPHLHVPRSLFLHDKFWLLRRLATFLRFVAWFLLGAGVLVSAVVIGSSMLHQDFQGALKGMYTTVVPLAVVFVYLLFTSEWIQVMLDIEENTRHTTVVMRELLTRMYPDQPAPTLSTSSTAAVAGVTMEPGIPPTHSEGA